MDITNLENSPQFVQKTLNLIEESFEYTKDNHFDVDFYPLYNKDNFKNCFILTEGDQVIAHIGRLQRELSLNNHIYPISMFGGIAVAKQARGKGHFRDFFTELLKKETQSTLSFLWSDKTDLYERFEFFACVELQSYTQEDSKFSLEVKKTAFADLTQSEFQKVKGLYKNSTEVRFLRSQDDWEKITHVSSATVYLIYKGDEVINYFIIGKGQDLTDTVHEYGLMNLEYLSIMRNYGQVWTTFKTKELDSQELFGSIVKINNHDLFKNFVKDYSGIEIIRNKHNFIDFSFNNDSYQLSQKDFLQGLLGPGRFKELDDKGFLYICGVDSI